MEKTIAHYAENSGKATKAISAENANKALTAEKLITARKINLTGDVEAETEFDGSEDLIVVVKLKAAENYATRAELANYASIKAVAALCVGRDELIEEYARKDELPPFKFSFEKFDGVPYMFIEIDGKKYRFAGVEV